MDKRVLLGVSGLVGVVLLVGVILALGSCNGDDDEVADEPTPTAVADDVDEVATDDADPTPVVDDTEATDDAEPVDDAPDEEIQLPEGQPEVPQSDEMAYGFNIAWRADEGGLEYNQNTRLAVEQAGFNGVRCQVHWSEVQREPDWLDPLPIDRMLDAYEGTNVRVMVSIVGAPDWALDEDGEQLLTDYNMFAEFMSFMADRYRGRIQAWEIWNEQNMAHEMHGTVRVSNYARLLEAGYQGVKSADPDALVIFGGLTPTGINDPEVAVNDVDYLRSFYEFEGGHFTQFFDVLGMHLNATNNPPDTTYPDNPGPGEWTDHNSFYFLRGQDLRAVMQEFGDERPVWVTEFGWTTENPAPGYEYGADVSEEDQANYLVGAFEVAREQMPWIDGMFVWNLNFTTIVSPEDEKYAWSVLNEDWSPRPAYEALQQMPKP